MSPTRAVVFDFYGTLSPGRSDEAQSRARRAQAAALGVDERAFSDELTATVDERFRGAGGSVEGSLRWVTARLGVDVAPPHLARAAVVRMATESEFGHPRPDAVEVLDAIRARGLRIGVVSDCSAELPRYFPDLPLASLVDVPVFSFVEGVRKPDPEIFLLCCTRLGVEPGECLYVGDGGSGELAGARAVGMRAVHLDVADEAESVVYGRHLDWDGERIGSLREVLDLL